MGIKSKESIDLKRILLQKPDVFGIVLGTVATIVTILFFIISSYQKDLSFFNSRENSDRIYKELLSKTYYLDHQLKAELQERIKLKGDFIQFQDSIKQSLLQMSVPNRATAVNKILEEFSSSRTNIKEAMSTIDSIAKRTSSFDQRMAKLESVIMNDPLKALEIPILRRDMLAYQQQFERDLNSLRNDTSRIYDMTKWLFGLMAIVSLSLVGTAIGNVFKREAPKETSKQT